MVSVFGSSDHPEFHTNKEVLEITDDTFLPISFDEYIADGNECNGLFGEAERELYSYCTKYPTLTFIVKLMHLKVLNHLSNKSFNMLLEVLKEVFSEGNNVPGSFYVAKKMLRDLRLGYKKIQACKYAYALLWKDHKRDEKCPKYDEPRYKYNGGKVKMVPQKVLRYCPLKPRGTKTVYVKTYRF